MRLSIVFAGMLESKRGDQIHHDVVVVSRVDCDIVTASFDDGANHIDRLIAIERGDLDRDDILNFREFPPKLERQHAGHLPKAEDRTR